MGNIKKIKANRLAPVYDEKRRPTEIVENLEELKNEGQILETYTPKAGAIYRFPAMEDAEVRKQPVNPGSESYQFLIACEMSTDGGETWVPSWFSLNHLAKRDAENNPVHPTWHALGNVYARMERLCELGELKVSDKARSIMVPQFVQIEGQRPKRRTKIQMDKNGKPVLNEDGEPNIVNDDKPQDVYDITPAN